MPIDYQSYVQRPLHIIPDQALIMTANTSPWLEAPLTINEHPTQSNQTLKGAQAFMAQSRGSKEEELDPNTHVLPSHQSIDTFEHAQSVQRRNDVTLLQNGNPVRCSLGLCCDNMNITVSREMSIEDICYINHADLNRGRDVI